VWEDRGPAIREKLPAWGERVFGSVFADGQARFAYERARDRGLEVIFRSADPALLGLPCRKSLAIDEELGNRPGMAGTYHQLGVTAQQRGRLGEADDWYRKALAIEEELGDLPGSSFRSRSAIT
jgi:hypothetical protein